MKISLKYFSTVLLACLVATATIQLKAQVVLGPTAGGIDLKGGNDFAISTQTTSYTTPVSRFLWLPAKGALLVGPTYSTPILTDIGQYSGSFGEGSLASGYNSFAL